MHHFEALEVTTYMMKKYNVKFLIVISLKLMILKEAIIISICESTFRALQQNSICIFNLQLKQRLA